MSILAMDLENHILELFSLDGTSWAWCHDGHHRNGTIQFHVDGISCSFNTSTWKVTGPDEVSIEDLGGAGLHRLHFNQERTGFFCCQGGQRGYIESANYGEQKFTFRTPDEANAPRNDNQMKFESEKQEPILGITIKGLERWLVDIGWDLAAGRFTNQFQESAVEWHQNNFGLHQTFNNGYFLIAGFRAFLKSVGQDHESACMTLKRQGSHHVSIAQVFVSHIQSEPPETTLNCMKSFGMSEAKLRFFWLDYTSLKQGVTDWNLNRVSKIICAIGHTLLVAHPWYGPDALKRKWCGFEVIETVRAKANFSIALPPKSEQDFLNELQKTHVGSTAFFQQCLASISITSAGTGSKEDGDLLLAWMQSLPGGLSYVDQQISKAVHNALLSLAIARANAKEDSELADGVGMLLYLRGRSHESLPFFQRSFSIAKRKFGDGSEQVCRCLDRLAHVCERREALAYALQLIKQGEQLEGANSNFVMLACAQASSIFLESGEFELAENHARRAFHIAEQEVSGKSVPHTARKLANVLQQVGDLDGAIKLLERALYVGDILFEGEYMDNSATRYRLALALNAKGDRTRAAACLREAHRIAAKAVGPEDDWVLEMKGILESWGSWKSADSPIPSKTPLEVSCWQCLQHLRRRRRRCARCTRRSLRTGSLQAFQCLDWLGARVRQKD